MSELLDATGDQRQAALDRAAELLRAGELVVLPTDTLYGVAADAFNLDATTALRTVKERDRAVPLPVLVRTPKQLPGFVAAVPAAAERLIAAFWPGPLTLVLALKGGLRWDLGRTDGAVSVRMPLDEVVLELIREVGPLAATAANAPGGASPATAQDARAQLGEGVAAVVDDGPRDAARSTIVDLTRAAPRVLRDGALPTPLVLEVAAGELDPVAAAAALTEGGEQDAAADGVEGTAEDPSTVTPVDARPLDGLRRRPRDGRGEGK